MGFDVKIVKGMFSSDSNEISLFFQNEISLHHFHGLKSRLLQKHLIFGNVCIGFQEKKKSKQASSQSDVEGSNLMQKPNRRRPKKQLR